MNRNRNPNSSSPRQAQPQTSPKPSETALESEERPSDLLAERIAARAYEIFVARGGEHGHHEEDWYQAERELRLGRQ
jgi:hypothetical protein